uniref:Hydrophobin n=1 Tax=Moniliophthora roreri TaxID=221103 RepID=A0A0W0G013_MONRR
MFAKSVAFTLTTFSVLATTHECSTGPIQCCNSIQAANSPVAAGLLGLLGIAVQSYSGITCTPISVLSLGGNSCTSQTVCCENNNFNSVITLGCTPINVSL